MLSDPLNGITFIRELTGRPEILEPLIAADAQETVMRLIPQPADTAYAQIPGYVPRRVHTIGLFYYRAYNGGIEMVLSRLSAFWARAGYRIVLITDFPETREDYPFPEGTRRRTLPDTFQLTPESRVARYRAMRNILQEEKVDVLIHNAWLSFNLLWDLLAVKSTGVPYIQYIHGAFSCQFAEGQPREMDQLYTLTRILPLADHIVSLSSTFDRFWHRFNPHTTPVLNPCPPARKAAAGIRPDPNTLLWVGRISPEKQPTEAVRILYEARKLIPGLKLKIVGGTDAVCKPYEDQVRELITALHLEGAVSLEGYRENVEDYYHEASLLLITSAHEGFCLAIAEAKTCGLPCVAYDLPYLCFAEDPRGFFTVPQGDAAAAARQAAALIRSPGEMAEARQAALESAAAFSEARLTGVWQSIFSRFETGEAPASAGASADPDAVILNMLLEHAHIGLEKLKSRAEHWQEDAAGGLLASVFDARYYAERYPDLMQAFGTDRIGLLKHFIEFGMTEGRQACALFNPQVYRENYADLRSAFGNDLKAYYLHFLLHGRAEGRTAAG